MLTSVHAVFRLNQDTAAASSVQSFHAHSGASHEPIVKPVPENRCTLRHSMDNSAKKSSRRYARERIEKLKA